MSDLFECHVGDCDVFAFDNIGDLAEHIAKGDHTSPAMRASTQGIAARFEANARPLNVTSDGNVRSFSPGGTRATVATSTDRGEATASDAQLRFIARLADEKGISFDTTGLTKRQASVAIDSLKKATGPKSAPAPARSTEPCPCGVHGFDGRIYKVQNAKSHGRPYAKLLDVESNRWEYAPGAIRNLSAATLLTLEEAKAFGRQTGVCCNCGRTLTNPASIEAGIGPICAGGF